MATSATTVSCQTLPWTSMTNLEDSLRTNPKPLMVFIHTDWCKYCKMQENITFENPIVIHFLTENFYCLKINAEDERGIAFMGRNYAPGSGGDFHSLARMLGMENGKLLFPTTVFYFIDNQAFKRFQGLQRAEDLTAFIKESEEVIP